jgi:hypothetical protein
MSRLATLGLGLSAVCLSVAGCRAHGASADSQCLEVDAKLPADATADGLEGEYRLTLVAARSPDARTSVTGSMVLRANDPAHLVRATADGTTIPGVRYTHYGWTDLDLDDLGALEIGSLGSTDPDEPGVLVIENRQTRDGSPYVSITLRFGSLANRLSASRFDEGFTALYAGQITSGGFAGTWASGEGRGRVAEGYFCATRTGS